MKINIFSYRFIFIGVFVCTFIFGSQAQTVFTIASTNPAVPAGYIAPNASRAIIFKATVTVSGSGWGGNFSNLTITPAGTFTSSDIKTPQWNNGIIVWYSNADNFSAASQISNPHQPVSGTSLLITTWSPSFNVGNTYYIWITVDISSTATIGHTIAVNALTTANFTFSTGTKTGSTSAGGVQTIGTAPASSIWIGSTSTVWGTPSNWKNNTLPISGSDIEFATTANNGGTAAINDLHVPTGIANAKTIGKLTNASTRNLIIPADAHLTVNNVISIKNANGTNSTDPAKIQLKASSALPNASFIINCAAQSASTQPDLYASVEMYAKGFRGDSLVWTDNISGSPTQGVNFGARYHWQYFGVPVESIVANPTLNGSHIRMYDESYNGDNTRYYQKWRTLNNSSVLQAFKGYEITQNAATTYTIQGKLQYCDKTITLTRSAAPVTGASGNLNNVRYGLGQNVFGNSFTASIDIEALVFPDKVEPTVYLYNTGRFTDWGNYGALNSGTLSAGQYTSIPQNVASTVYDDKIPSMNGFLLIHRGPAPYYSTTSDVPVTMTLPYAAGIKPNSRPQTAPRQPLSYLRVQLQSESTIDNLWLFSREGTTNKMDDGWDGRKFFGTPKAFIFTENTDGAMQVNVDETIDGSLISFYANEDKEYTLTLVKSNLDQYSQLHLIDYYERRLIPITSDTTVYHFTSDNKGNVEKRFRIVNNSDIHLNSDEMKMLEGYLQNNNKLIVYNFTTKNGVVSLYDTAGKTIIRETMQLSLNEIPVSLQRGIYILSMEADGKRESVKLVVR